MTVTGNAQSNKQLRYRSAVIGGGLLLLLLFSLLGGRLETAVKPLLSGAGNALVSLAVYLVMMLIPLLWLRFALAAPDRILFPLGKGDRSNLFPLALISFGALIALNLLGWGFTDWLENFFLVPGFPGEFGTTFAETAVRLISSSLFPAVLEELVFRGTILQSLRPWGDRFAVIWGAVFFMLCHSSITQWVPALGAGLLFGWLACRTGSLRFGMAIHLANNLYAATANELGSRLTGVWLPILLLILGALGAVALIKKKTRHPTVRSSPLPARQRLAGICTIPVLLAAVMMIWRAFSTLTPL